MAVEHRMVAIVTGASRGIGRAASVALSDLGWGVALVSRSEERLREIASQVKQSLVLALDISDPRNADEIIARTFDEFGRIDAIVNNAGVAPLLPVEETTDDIWRQTIDTNL